MGGETKTQRSFSDRIDAFFSTARGDFDDGAWKYLRRVYSAVAMALVSYAVGAYVAVAGLFMAGSMMGSFLALAGLLYIFFSDSTNQPRKLAVLLGSAFCLGHSTWPLLVYAMLVDSSLIMMAGLSTAFVFMAFSISAILARRGSYLFLGYTLLQMSLLALTLVFTQSFFGFPGRWVFSFYPYLMLAVACGFVLFDTQLVIERYRLGGIPDPTKDACILFIDAVDIFRQLLIILTENKRQEQKRRRD